MLCWPSAPIIISAWRTVPSRNCTDGFSLDVPRAGGEARCTSALNITSAPARVAASCKILWRSLYCSRMNQYVMPKSQPDDLDTRASCKTWHHCLGLRALPTQGIRSTCRSQLSRELASRQEVRKARHRVTVNKLTIPEIRPFTYERCRFPYFFLETPFREYFCHVWWKAYTPGGFPQPRAFLKNANLMTRQGKANGS